MSLGVTLGALIATTGCAVTDTSIPPMFTEGSPVQTTTQAPATSPTESAPPVESAPPTTPIASSTALDGLAVKGRAPKTGYARAEFGKAWADDVSVEWGHNGCSTREDILRRDLTDIVFHDDGCRILSGTLDDPYTGTTVPFVRGQSTSSKVQIDHVVAMADAWQKGAQTWTRERRRDFANDPRNLQAVSGSVNQKKGAGDAATWLPPNKAYRCTYVQRQIEVKAAYRLWVTEAEKQAMSRVLADCP